MTVSRAELASGRRAANRRRLTERLHDAVERSLEETGGTYAELSIERLLEASGVARSTFYYHFKDKHSLIAALAEDVLTEIEDNALAWWEVSLTRASLEEATKNFFRIYWRHRVVLAAAVDNAATDAVVREKLERMWRRITDEVTRLIEIAQEENQLSKELDPRRTADWILWMTERGLYQLIRRGNWDEVERYANVYVGIVWSTLGPSDESESDDR